MKKNFAKAVKECLPSRIKKTLPKRKITFKKPAKKPIIKLIK